MILTANITTRSQAKRSQAGSTRAKLAWAMLGCLACSSTSEAQVVGGAPFFTGTPRQSLPATGQFNQPLPYNAAAAPAAPYSAPFGGAPVNQYTTPSNVQPYSSSPSYSSSPAYAQPSYSQPGYGQPSYGAPQSAMPSSAPTYTVPAPAGQYAPGQAPTLAPGYSGGMQAPAGGLPYSPSGVTGMPQTPPQPTSPWGTAPTLGGTDPTLGGYSANSYGAGCDCDDGSCTTGYYRGRRMDRRVSRACNGWGRGGPVTGGGCADGSCVGPGMAGGDCGPDWNGPAWFGGLGGLIMTRDNGNRRVLTVSANNVQTDLMSSRDPAYNWVSGYEARLGRVIGCNSAIEATFWMLDPISRSALVTDPASALNTTMECCMLTAGGTDIDAVFNNSQQQSFWRRDQLYNTELNWLQNIGLQDSERLSLTGIAGARWIRFQEQTSVGAAAAGTNFGDNGGTTSAFYDQSLINNFIGGQLGARAQYFITPRLRAYATPKAGVGALTVDKSVVLRRGDGIRAVDEQTFKTDVGMIGQIDLGFAFQLTPRLSTYGGYRALGITGLAMFENNIPVDFSDTTSVREVQSNGSMILHGAVSGIQFAY